MNWKRPQDIPLETVLESHFGFSSFRPGQREIIEAVLAGRDCVGVLPTGAGKSLCYQLPAVARGGLTLVVSPLIALMKDQIDALHARGIASAAINSSLHPDALRARVEAMASGRFQLVYVAPERFRNAYFMRALQGTKVGLVAIDEAHCVSMWGHDFRPDYLLLADVIAGMGSPQVLALTATATGRVRDDLTAQLGLGAGGRQAPVTVVSGFSRPELTLGVRRVQSHEDKLRRCLEILAEQPTGIVYCATRANVDKVAALLQQRGITTVAYHAGLADEVRIEAQERFISGRAAVAVATNAFGMGIDRADLRCVIHWDLPGSVEAYYQEAGRAGRDGLPARCEILFNHADVYTQESFFRDLAAEQAERERARLRELIGYISSRRCRHGLILAYFDDPAAQAMVDCAACDNCLRRAGTDGRQRRAPDEDEWIQIQKVLSCAVRLGGRFGRARLAQVLGGSQDKNLLRSGLQELPTYGALSDLSLPRIRALIEALEDAECLEAVGLEYPRIRITGAGRQVMMREAEVLLSLPAACSVRAPGNAGSKGRAPRGETEADTALLAALRTMRSELARERGVPAYHIFSNATMAAIAEAAPTDRQALAEVKGIGPAKLTDLGERILQIVDRVTAVSG